MSNAFDKASLVMLPHAYEDGKVYSLKPTDRSGDFTFSRGTDTATRVGEDGYIKKETANLLLQSNSFDTTWQSIRVGESTGFAGYDGTNDAWKIVPNTQLNDHRLDQSTSVSGVWTFSIYAKAAGYNFLYILFSGIGNSGKVIDISPNQGVVVDNKGGVQAIDESITDAGNDWWKITLTYSGTLGTLRIITLPANDTSTYAGDGTSGILIQDAQINQGLVAQDYLETTTAPVYGGLTDNMPRLDYTDATCPSLLLEPQRRNLVRNSEYIGGSGWVPQGLTFEYNAAISPEGFQNATLLKTTTSYSRHNIRESNDVAADSAFSVFAKAKELRYIQIASAGNAEQYANFDLLASNIEDVVVQSGSLFSNVKAEDYGNGWYRLSAVCDNSNNDFYISLLETGTQGWLWTWTGANNTDGLYVYGAQHEDNGSGGAASYPTSYIPTYGSSQTRAAEKVYKNNAQSLIGQDEGTIYFEWVAKKTEAVYSMFKIDNGTSSNRLQFTLNQGNNPRFGFYYIVDGVNAYTSVNDQDLTEGATYKSAVKYTQTSLVIYLNGTKIVDYTNFNVSNGVFSEIAFGNGAASSSFLLDQPVKKVLLYKEPLDNNKLEALTTL